MKQQIRVVVYGPPKSGKSTIAKALKEVLDAWGIENEVTDDEELGNFSTAGKMQAIKNQVSVTIDTEQTNRVVEYVRSKPPLITGFGPKIKGS